AGDGAAPGPQRDGQARDERRLGPDDDEVDPQLQGQRDERTVVVGAHGMAVRERGDSRVAGRRVQLVEAAAAGERPGERVLAAPRSDDERPHRRILCERRDTLRLMDAPPYSAAAVDVLR